MTAERPADCDAYVALTGFAPRDQTVIPQAWCARLFRVDERIRVGDEHGRRATARVLDDIRVGVSLSILTSDEDYASAVNPVTP